MRAPRPDRGEHRDVPPAPTQPRHADRTAPDQGPGYRIEDGALVIPGNPVADWAKKRPPSVEPLLGYVTRGRMKRSVIDALLSMGKPLEITVEIDPETEKVAAWRVRTKAFGGDAASTLARRSEG